MDDNEMEEMGRFIKSVLGGDGDIPADVKSQLDNKKAANQIIRQDLESEYATLQAGLIAERIESDKAEIKATLAKHNFTAGVRDMMRGAIALGVFAGSYLTVILCVWVTKQL